MHGGVTGAIVPPVEIVNDIVTSGVNPVPDTVTGAPAWPWFGHIMIAGEVTLDANGMLVEPTSPPESITLSITEYVPCGNSLCGISALSPLSSKHVTPPESIAQDHETMESFAGTIDSLPSNTTTGMYELSL